MKLPKEVLVEKLNYNIIETPLKDGIRAWRALEQCMQKAMNDGTDIADVEVFAGPLISHINFLFDLHEELEAVLDSKDFRNEMLLKELEAERAQFNKGNTTSNGK